MEVKIDSLIPYEKIIEDPVAVFKLVEIHGSVVLLKDNQPQYVIQKYIPEVTVFKNNISENSAKHTLQSAMKIVLQDVENYTMHAADLAEEIYVRGLYRQKDGGKAGYNQIRARCGHYPDLFETLPKNHIKLKTI